MQIDKIKDDTVHQGIYVTRSQELTNFISMG